MNPVRDAVYYNYEGATLIITNDEQGGYEIEVYDMCKGSAGKEPLSMFMSISMEDWGELANRVAKL